LPKGTNFRLYTYIIPHPKVICHPTWTYSFKKMPTIQPSPLRLWRTTSTRAFSATKNRRASLRTGPTTLFELRRAYFAFVYQSLFAYQVQFH
jgi:hypothetical protein